MAQVKGRLPTGARVSDPGEPLPALERRGASALGLRLGKYRSQGSREDGGKVLGSYR